MPVLILKIRQAECALADGRLDEAYALAQPAPVRSHRRGQDLVTKLVNALVERGQEHLEAGRTREAVADCEKASLLGGNLPGIAALRSAALETTLDGQRADRQRARLIEAGRNALDRGDLAAGQEILSPVANQESRAAVLLREVEQRRNVVGAAVALANAAIAKQDWEGATQALGVLRPAELKAAPALAVVAEAGRLAVNSAQQALVGGELHLAEAMLAAAGALAHDTVQAQQMRHALAECHAAWSCIDQGKLKEAQEAVRRASALLPAARWPESVLKHLKNAADATDELRTGPLALLSRNTAHALTLAAPHMPAPVAPVPPVARFTPEAPATTDLPTRFILQVDGAGSFLVLRDALVTVGPVSSPRNPDLGLMAEPGGNLVRIERLEDDYFLRQDSTAGQPNGSRLLGNGDEIVLSPRCRLRFRLPNVASTSAVLDLTGSRLPRADVRRVILLDREIIIGPGTLSHVRVDQTPAPVILLLKGGRLHCQSREPLFVADRQVEPNSPIALGAHVRSGAVSFVVTRV